MAKNQKSSSNTNFASTEEIPAEFERKHYQEESSLDKKGKCEGTGNLKNRLCISKYSSITTTTPHDILFGGHFGTLTARALGCTCTQV